MREVTPISESQVSTKGSFDGFSRRHLNIDIPALELSQTNKPRTNLAMVVLKDAFEAGVVMAEYPKFWRVSGPHFL
jgi:hypothetical protein